MVHKTSKPPTRRAARCLTKFAGAGLLLAIGVAPALSADDPLLQRLEGQWIGKGTVRMSASSKPERIYCKIANKLVDGGQALEQKGRCAVADNSGRLKGKLASKGKGNYEGSLDTIQTKGPAVLDGHAEKDKIVLSAQFVDRFSRQAISSDISLIVGDGSAYRLVSEMRDPGTGQQFQSGDILFEPDKKPKKY